jgi:hypothetical protein
MRYRVSILAVAAVLMFSGCYGASHLKTSYLADTASIRGKFNVVYYGGRYLDDPGNLVVLDIADDKYTFVPYAVKGSYRTDEGVSVDEAMRKALEFLKHNKYYNGVRYRTIYSPDGTLIGYEMAPRYESFTYVMREPVSVNYYMEGEDTVRFIVHEHLQNEPDLKTISRRGPWRF